MMRIKSFWLKGCYSSNGYYTGGTFVCENGVWLPAYFHWSEYNMRWERAD